MASAFSHAIAAIAIGYVVNSVFVPYPLGRAREGSWKYFALSAFCAVIPDADAIGYWRGVEYGSVWGHRGITHSLFFAVLLAGLVMFLFYRTEKTFSRSWWALYLTFFVCTVSHGILDAFTTGGKGVAFFAPFWNERYFFPWKVIKVSPISIQRFFSSKGIEVLKSEFIWVWIPSLLVIFMAYIVRKVRFK